MNIRVQSMEKIIVLRGEYGKIIEENIVEVENIHEAVKKYASKALELWDPEFSDFIIIKDKYEVALKLPLTREQVKRFMKFGIKRSPDGYARFNIPVYIISYDSIWVESDYVDRRVYLIAVYVDENIKKDLERLVIDTTKGVTRQIEITEEELEELEQEI